MEAFVASIITIFSHPKYPNALRGDFPRSCSKSCFFSMLPLGRLCFGMHWSPLPCLWVYLRVQFLPPHCTELLLVFRLLYIILDGQYPMIVSSVNNDHTRTLESKIIKIEILPPEFVFWSAKCRVWQAFTKYPSVGYLDKLLRNSKTISLFKMTWWGFRLQEHLWSSIVLPWYVSKSSPWQIH
jgi:hypothetical protein